MAKVLERSLYQTDYYAWTKQQAAALRAMAARARELDLDLENLAEEVESLGRSDLNTVRSQVQRIIEHLLKLEYSPASEPRARLARLGRIRLATRSRITSRRACFQTWQPTSTSCSIEPGAALPRAAPTRRAQAADALPTDCPYSFEQIVGQDLYPQNRHGLVDEID